MSKKVLVIGDAHVETGQDLTRFDALSSFILKTRPDEIVIIGDFLSLESLSAWDSDKRKLMEGRRYWEEILAGNEALDRMQTGVLKYNKGRAAKKQKQYTPRWVYIMGNHEDRLRRYFERNPTFDDGKVGIQQNLYLDKRGFHVVEYTGIHKINQVAFTHIPIGRGGSPISGMGICKKALELYNLSVVFGHTHCFSTENRYRVGGEHLQQALNVGCFMDHIEHFRKGSNPDYWRGVVTLTIYDDMRFDFATTALHQLYAGEF